jgi:hypothetical protein
MGGFGGFFTVQLPVTSIGLAFGLTVLPQPVRNTSKTISGMIISSFLIFSSIRFSQQDPFRNGLAGGGLLSRFKPFH